MAPAYLIVKLQDGDILMMFDMFRNKESAKNHLQQLMDSNVDSDSSWWKILPCVIDDNFDLGIYEVVVFLDWENTNRIRFMGLYQEGNIPIGLYDQHLYYSERIELRP